MSLLPPETGFADPQFTWWAAVYVAAGAAVFWGKWGRSRLRPFILETVTDFVFQDKKYNQAKYAVEFCIFVSFGVLVGIGLASPHNPVQALAAGLGWTGLIAHNPSK